jgi:hypothetical protein
MGNPQIAAEGTSRDVLEELKRLQAVLQNYQRALEENKHPSVALVKEMQVKKDILFNAVQEVIARKQPPDHDVKPQCLTRDGAVPSYRQSLEDSLSHIRHPDPIGILLAGAHM